MHPRAMPYRFVLALLLTLIPTRAPVWAADPQPGPPLSIRRAAGPIVADGDLSDAGWQGVEPVTTWFETCETSTVSSSTRAS